MYVQQFFLPWTQFQKMTQYELVSISKSNIQIQTKVKFEISDNYTKSEKKIFHLNLTINSVTSNFLCASQKVQTLKYIGTYFQFRLLVKFLTLKISSLGFVLL